ncbi:MAG: ankyrin repeat domain-containing protein [Bryobacteraceae bacterium]
MRAVKLFVLAGLPAFVFAASDAVIMKQAGTSVALLQKVGAQWKTPCLSCHHQALPPMALAAARAHGIPVDEAVAQTVSQKAFRFLTDIDSAVQVKELIDPAVSEGYALLGAEAAGVAPSLTTAIYARHIARNQQADGSWATLDGRPPESGSLIAATAIGARAMGLYLPMSVDAERRERLEAARRWLLAAKAETTEDLSYRLLGLLWTGAPEGARKTAGQALLKTQRPDGGWTQTADKPDSDAYSTGQALTALRRAGAIDRQNPAFQKGIAWLLKTQAADGSWLVKTRLHTPAPVSPKYFESGFPYGHDQYISCAGTVWAVMALTEALPAAAKPAQLRTPAGVYPPAERWMETALFGSAAEVAKLDPTLATPGGTTVLMMAADNPAKVKALLAKGAKADAVAKSGFDAVMIACLYRGNRQTLELLLAAGASPKPRAGVRYKASVMPIVVFTNDTAMASVLLDKGADPNSPIMLLGGGPASPLNIATQMEFPDMVRLLAKRGANMDSPDDMGMTDLSWAALQHKNATAQALLELGAKADHKDKYGLTPLEHTKGISYHSPATEKLLTKR